jgi:hypothetical protein
VVKGLIDFSVQAFSIVKTIKSDFGLFQGRGMISNQGRFLKHQLLTSIAQSICTSFNILLLSQILKRNDFGFL